MISFSMLLINNNRSKAYLQNLIKNGFIPNMVIVLDDSKVTLVEHTENDKIISKDSNQQFIREAKDLDISFDEKEHILKTLKNNDINHIIIDTIDINSKDTIDSIKKVDDEYIVYSGPGGTILRDEILSLGKKFIHAHPGFLPKYRGSTTMYYSLLHEGKVGCSIITFTKDIDEGPILYRKEYIINQKDIDLDYLLDPAVRARSLVDFFKQCSNENRINPIIQEDNMEASTFYIIHPILKHLSILKHTQS